MSLLLALLGAPPAAPPIAAFEYDDEIVTYMRKNVAGQYIEGQVNDRTTGAPLTSSVTVYVTGDNGTQTAGGGTTTHKGNGAWNYAPTQAETNYNHIAFTFVHASGVVKTYNVFTYSYNPHDTAALGLTNLDATISSRMATYTQPTGFLAATFPATVASTTNITAGTITTATNVTTVNGLAAGVVTAASIAAAALNGKGDWNIGKTGYSLTQAFPTNFASMLITAGGAVTAGTVNDKTGYELSATAISNILTTQMTESYAADGVAPTLAQALFHLLGREYEFAISGDTLTVKKLDGTTTAMTFTLAPPGGPYSSITRAT